MRRFSFTARSLAWVVLASATALGGCAAPLDDEDVGSLDDALGGSPASASANARISGTRGLGVRVRKEPSTKSAMVGGLSDGARIEVECRTTGEAINGNTLWDYLPKYGGYVSDRYVTSLGGSIPTCGEARRRDTQAPPVALGPTPGRLPPPQQPGGPLGDALVAEARSWAGTRSTDNCNPFSTALGRSCEAWCADFVIYVWRQAGVNIDGITAYAGSFLTYGTERGTLKPRDSDDVRPGDAIVWANGPWDAAHVGMVTEMLANGDIRVINGNWSKSVIETVSRRSTTVSGYGIAGFVSPSLR